MKAYEIFDAENIMGIGFRETPGIDLSSLQTENGPLSPGDMISHIGGKKTSAGFLWLDFPEPITYRGLFHAGENPPGDLALFTCGDRPGCLDGFIEAYYCWHWLADWKMFIWSSQKRLSGRTGETDGLIIIRPAAEDRG
jgi:hypothetical protein